MLKLIYSPGADSNVFIIEVSYIVLCSTVGLREVYASKEKYGSLIGTIL